MRRNQKVIKNEKNELEIKSYTKKTNKKEKIIDTPKLKFLTMIW